MDVLEILKADYQRFPRDQTYDLYASDVYFKDPLNEFRGRDRYRLMIGVIQWWFHDLKMDLHAITQSGNQIRTDWTLKGRANLPWRPFIAIPGWSELTLNEAGMITAHIDYWHCSRMDVLKQHATLRQADKASDNP